MQKFKEFLVEKLIAQKAGLLEIGSISPDSAEKYAKEEFTEHGHNLFADIPSFKENFQYAKPHASKGKTLRKDMPVIRAADIKKFKKYLKHEHGIRSKITRHRVHKLLPTQKQIYFDKSIEKIVKKGPKKFKKHLLSGTTFFIIGSDNKIIDGHHRYLAGILLDPNMKVYCFEVNVPAKELMKYALHFTDDVLNRPRNN